MTRLGTMSNLKTAHGQDSTERSTEGPGYSIDG